MKWTLCSSQVGKYDESLKHLEALQELNRDDYKIAMNKAIVKFYKSGQTTTGTLKQALMSMKNQVTAETWLSVHVEFVFSESYRHTALCFFMMS